MREGHGKSPETKPKILIVYFLKRTIGVKKRILNLTGVVVSVVVVVVVVVVLMLVAGPETLGAVVMIFPLEGKGARADWEIDARLGVAMLVGARTYLLVAVVEEKEFEPFLRLL